MTLPLNDRVTSTYTADGTNKEFNFDFRVFFNVDTGSYGLEVRKVIPGGYDILSPSLYTVVPNEDLTAGKIIFAAAPVAGTEIYLAGKTPTVQQLNLTNYGRFSAEAIEVNFDFLTAIIQEWKSSLSIETAERIENDLLVNANTAALYAQWQAWAEANVPGFAATYLNSQIYDFRQQWIDALNGIANGVIPALGVSTLNGNNQQQVNDSVGAKWYSKPLGYALHDRVRLNNGTIVRSTIPNNTNDPNSNLTGWKLGNSDGEILTWANRTQEDKNKENITASDLGLVGNGITDQTAKFALIESLYSGVLIDLQGGTYKVTDRPTGNKYANGWWFTTEKFPAQYVTKLRADNDIIAIGDNAALGSIRARNCIAIGQDAMRSNTYGRHNIAIGISALHFLDGISTSGINGTRNIAIGGNAGRFATTASRNIIMGRDTAHNITDAHMNIILGNAAVMGDGPNILTPGEILNQTPLTPQNSVVIGTESGKYLNTSEVVLIGHQAGKNLKSDSFTVGVGAYAFEKHQSDRSHWGTVEQAVNVTCTYAQSGNKTITVTTPTAHGLSTGFKVWLRFTTGKNADTSYQDDIWFDVTVVNSTTFTIQSTQNETASGNALYTRVSTAASYTKNSGQSVGVGYSVGNGPDNYRSVGVGHQAGGVGLGTENVAVGFRALFVSSVGVGNVAVGAYSQGSGTGSSNTSVGTLTLNVATGSGNTGVGAQAARLLTSGADNTAVGSSALSGLTTASNNSALGVDALKLNTLASAFNFSNCVGIGKSSAASGNNQIQLGASGTTVYAFGAVQDRSDERDKTDIEGMPDAMTQFILELNPVQGRWDMRDDYVLEKFPVPEYPDEPVFVKVPELDKDNSIEYHSALLANDKFRKEYDLELELYKNAMNEREELVRNWWSNPVKDGSKKRNRLHNWFIAQEVKDLSERLGIDFAGLQHHEKDGGLDIYSIGYEEFIPPIVATIQKLSKRMDEIEKRLNDLEN